MYEANSVKTSLSLGGSLLLFEEFPLPLLLGELFSPSLLELLSFLLRGVFGVLLSGGFSGFFDLLGSFSEEDVVVVVVPSGYDNDDGGGADVPEDEAASPDVACKNNEFKSIGLGSRFISMNRVATPTTTNKISDPMSFFFVILRVISILLISFTIFF